MIFNKDGVIDPGIHEIDMKEFYETFVKQFTTSERREEIFNSLLEFLKDLMVHYVVEEVWIDGSFVSEKINPNDVDIVVYFKLEDYIRIFPEWARIRTVKNIDAYCMAIANKESQSKLSLNDMQTIVNQRNYWRGQFGFDRADIPKGIINLTNLAILDYLKGGESNVVASN